MGSQQGFWNTLDDLVAHCEIVIDREAGSLHPRFPEIIYPLDYGYLAGTSAGDGGGIDVWVGSLGGEKRANATLVTIDLVRRDVEIKFLAIVRIRI